MLISWLHVGKWGGFPARIIPAQTRSSQSLEQLVWDVAICLHHVTKLVECRWASRPATSRPRFPPPPSATVITVTTPSSARRSSHTPPPPTPPPRPPTPRPPPRPWPRPTPSRTSAARSPTSTSVDKQLVRRLTTSPSTRRPTMARRQTCTCTPRLWPPVNTTTTAAIAAFSLPFFFQNSFPERLSVLFIFLVCIFAQTPDVFYHSWPLWLLLFCFIIIIIINIIIITTIIAMCPDSPSRSAVQGSSTYEDRINTVLRKYPKYSTGQVQP